MKLLLIILSLVAFYSSASTSQFDCKYLDYNLELEAMGFEHITHVLKINGKTTISELVKDNWFIEEVVCNESGFKIIASHIQYNDPTKKVFMLTFNPQQGYKIDTSK